MSMVLTVLALPGRIPSQRLNALNNLWFHWHVRHPPSENTLERRQWTRVWQILASMEGLKKLRVQIFPFFIWEDDWPYEEKRLMEDTKFVTRPNTFEVDLAWSEGQTPLHLPCIVTRIPNNG
jgi:hypothetical protein